MPIVDGDAILCTNTCDVDIQRVRPRIATLYVPYACIIFAAIMPPQDSDKNMHGSLRVVLGIHMQVSCFSVSGSVYRVRAVVIPCSHFRGL